ncbi:MAG: hypothetical protein QNJ34_07150 [Xenococcaceae cyanobacterium MO_188.B29]|nr:hypothetical protein [Xenococcaceae cyanobacterium MO_188.B29]
MTEIILLIRTTLYMRRKTVIKANLMPIYLHLDIALQTWVRTYKPYAVLLYLS